MDELLEALRKFRDERAWAQFHKPKDLAISVSIEAAELLEHFQWRHDGHDPSIDKAAVADELADVLLYTLLLFDKLHLDPIAEGIRKIETNSQKYPVSEAYGRTKFAMRR